MPPSPKPPHIRLVITEQKRRLPVAEKPRISEARTIDRDRVIIARNQLGFLGIWPPRPSIPRPKLRQDMQFSGFGGAIVDRHLQENVLNIGLCVFYFDIEIAIVGKDAG